eukprot:scaffold44117_cov22-Tisochrysis_lutea.AAC.1
MDMAGWSTPTSCAIATPTTCNLFAAMFAKLMRFNISTKSKALKTSNASHTVPPLTDVGGVLVYLVCLSLSAEKSVL